MNFRIFQCIDADFCCIKNRSSVGKTIVQSDFNDTKWESAHQKSSGGALCDFTYKIKQSIWWNSSFHYHALVHNDFAWRRFVRLLFMNFFAAISLRTLVIRESPSGHIRDSIWYLETSIADIFPAGLAAVAVHNIFYMLSMKDVRIFSRSTFLSVLWSFTPPMYAYAYIEVGSRLELGDSEWGGSS